MDESPVIPFVYRKLRTLVDGTIRLEVDIEPSYSVSVMTIFNEPNLPGGLVRLNQTATTANLREEVGNPTGKFAKKLRLSGFFRMPVVWRAIGTDKEFLEWLKQQKCGLHKYDFAHCHGDVVAAHVRRVANGAGTGIKPEYSAIPLCDAHHRQQHTEGESAIGGRDFIDKLRIYYLEQWGWITLKEQLGFAHWHSADIDSFKKWIVQHDLEQYVMGIL